MTRMTGHHAAKLLEDILRWRWQDWTPIEQVSAIRYDTDVVQGHDDRISLPFGLDSVIDSVDSDGAVGVCDAESIDKALRFWVPWFSDWVDQPPTYREQPGAWMLQQLQENPVFTNVNGWHLNEDGTQDDYGLQCQTAWDDYCNELRIIHRKVAHATGNQPRNRGLCPRCKQGNMLQQPLPKRGYDDEATCSNKDCQAKIDYSDEETSASIRAIMRQYDGEDIYLPLKDLRCIWPELKEPTLHSWVRRGHVHQDQRGYRLADINARKRVPA